MDIASAYDSPWLIAVNRVLLRLPVPRHSPCALYSLTYTALPLTLRIYAWVIFTRWNIVILPYFATHYRFLSKTDSVMSFSFFSSCFLYSVFKVRFLEFLFEIQNSILKLLFKYWSSNFNYLFFLILFQTRSDTQHYTFVYASVSDEVWSKIWWAQVDSNHRPHAYQACALTTWAMSPYLVEISGIEPLTPCLQSRCSPSWAIPPYLLEPLLVLNEPQKLNNDF